MSKNLFTLDKSRVKFVLKKSLVSNEKLESQPNTKIDTHRHFAINYIHVENRKREVRRIQLAACFLLL